MTTQNLPLQPEQPMFKTTRQKPENPQDQMEAEAPLEVTGTSEDGSHMDGFSFREIEEPDNDDGPQMVDETGAIIEDEEPPEMMDKDTFFVVFSTAFSMPGLFIPDFAPMAIQEHEQTSGRAASDACHSLLEIYYPAALMPGGEVLAHALVAGPFILGKVMIVRAIVAAKRNPPPREPMRTDREPQPANENAPIQPKQQSPIDEWMLPGQAA